jgi:hypothetical protein
MTRQGGFLIEQATVKIKSLQKQAFLLLFPLRFEKLDM